MKEGDIMLKAKLDNELIKQLSLVVASKAKTNSDIEKLCDETYQLYLKAYEYFEKQKPSPSMEILK